MLNPFEQLKTVSAGPPHDFEEAAWLVVEAMESNVRRIALSQGDGGIDAAQGTWGKDGEMQVFQFKYFTDKLGTSQRKQITDSFQTARDNPLINLRKWTLVLPSRLRKECLHWFEEWKREQGSDIEMCLWDGDDLVERLENPKCAKARRFLKERGVVGINGDDRSLEPFAQTFRNSQAGTGIGFVIKVGLENKGTLTAVNPRLIVRHTETGCVAGAHDENWWKHEVEAFMPYNPRKLNGLRDIHPNAPVPILQIPLRAGDSFKTEILVKVSAHDLPLRNWRITVTPENLASGTVLHGVEINAEVAVELERKLNEPRTFSRPKPVNPLAVELLDHIRANEDEATRGLAVIRRGHPSDPTQAAVIPSSKPGGKSPLLVPKDDLQPAILELQQLGWLGNPQSNNALTIYVYRPE
jgi:hypothetical protein